jgi:hypothetical protein
MAFSISGDEHAGPIVATILVLLMVLSLEGVLFMSECLLLYNVDKKGAGRDVR